MLRFNTNGQKLEVLKSRLQEFTGEVWIHTDSPEYTYLIGDFIMDESNHLSVEDTDKNQSILKTLESEALIFKEEPITQEDSCKGESNLPEVARETTPLQEEEMSEEETISFPILGHTGASLRNLIHLLYTRGPLINKALGSNFSVSNDLIQVLNNDACTYTVANFKKTLTDYHQHHSDSGIQGLQIQNQQLIFTGFPSNASKTERNNYEILAALMNHHALDQKWIAAKQIDDSNEKFAMRVWLIRIGMNGEKYKRTRHALLKNLSGDTSFKTEAVKLRAVNKAKALRLTHASYAKPE